MFDRVVLWPCVKGGIDACVNEAWQWAAQLPLWLLNH